MKYAILILSLLCCFQSIGQKERPDLIRIDYECLEKDLVSALVDLSEQSGVNIAFSNLIIPKEKYVTLSVKNRTIGYALESMLLDTDLAYRIISNQIVIIKDEYKNANSVLTISGRIEDALSGEVLPGASVYLYDKSEGTIANDFGFYSLTIPKGLKRVYFQFVGFEQQILEIKLKSDTTINVYLTPKAQLNEVVILDNALDKKEEAITSSNDLPVDKINSISTLGGEPDVIRLTQLMPGVTSGADGLGGLSVRGGSADQNLILMDGIPIYNTGHALGLFSVFNPNIVKSANLIKGSIPARYGGRLSSILDIKTKNGNKNRTAGDISLGVIASKATLEGPIAGKKSSYLLSFRRTLLDPWISNASKFVYSLDDKTGDSKYYFYDANAKLNFYLNDRNQLVLSYYKGQDVFDNLVSSSEEIDGELFNDVDQDNWKWGNNVVSASLHSMWSDKLFAKSSIYYSSYDFKSFGSSSITRLNQQTPLFFNASLNKSSIADLGAKIDIDYAPTSNQMVKFGLSGIRHNFRPGLIGRDQTDLLLPEGEITERVLDAELNAENLNSFELNAYVEDEIRLGKSFVMNAGLRASAILVDDQSYFNLMPRISILAKSDQFYFKAGYNQMTQFLHLISNTGLGLPSDIWLPTTNVLKPEKSWMANIGAGFNTEGGVHLGLEAFYKSLSNVINSNEGKLVEISTNQPWEAQIPVGKGESYGFEFELHKYTGRSIWMLNYTYSKAIRDFDNINSGNAFEFRFHRPHQVKLVFIRKINKNAEFSLSWMYMSGNPVSAPSLTSVIIDEDGNRIIVPEYPEKHNEKFPDYHRLDWGLSFYSDFSWARQKLTIGVYNSYNQSNPFYLDLQEDRDNPLKYAIYQYSILPIIPSLSYSLSF